MRVPRPCVVVLALAVALTVPAVSGAQPAKVARIGLLSPDGTFADTSPLLAAFRQGLAALGYAEGRDVALLRPDASSARARSPGHALVSLGVDVIVAASTLGAQIARDATRTIPIVFVGVSDPVGSGLLSSLDPPRGDNVAGLTDVDVRSSARSLELLKQAAPNVTRVALLANPAAPLAFRYIAETEATARSLGLTLHRRNVQRPDELQDAFSAILSDYDQALVVLPDPLFNGQRAELVAFASRYRLPAVYGYRAFAPAGGLMTYGTDLADVYRRAAGVVDRILKGVAPGDLAIEAPTKFILLVNLGTAERLRLTIPPALRLQADQLIP